MAFHTSEGSASINSDSVTIDIVGTPIALQRPKVGSGRPPSQAKKSPLLSGSPTTPPTKPRRYHTYSPSQKDQKLFTAAVTKTIGHQKVPQILRHANCSVELIFSFPRPKSHFDTNGNVLPQYKSPNLDVRKADLDNLVKFVLDCIQGGVIIQDDFQVTRLAAEKKWSDACCVNNVTGPSGSGSIWMRVKVHDMQPPAVILRQREVICLLDDSDEATDDESMHNARLKHSYT